jgi:thymidylate synthase
MVGGVIAAASLAEVWEQAVLNVLENGRWVEHEEPDEQPFREAAGPCLLAIEKPLEGSRYHRWIMSRCLPQDLVGYVEEVCAGIKDHFIDLSDPDAWHYTYHQRLRAYPSDPPVDQLALVVEKLKVRPTTRRAQAITWVPSYDPQEKHPPCLQRIWFAVREGKLVMHTHWRSRDAYLAAFMNIVALTELQRRLAEQIGIAPGPYYDMTDCFHIYTRDLGEVTRLQEAVAQARASGTPGRLWMGEEQFQAALEADVALREERAGGV